MQISELEEFQDLTTEMVRAWLRRLSDVRLESDGYWWWNFNAPHDKKGPCWQDRLIDIDLGSTIVTISAVSRVGVQSLLREMNPRMRNGLPSEAEREAHEEHGGRWIASRREEYTHTTIVRFLRGITAVKLQYEDHRTTYDPTNEIKKWSFWPCDAHGNKVPRPKVQP